MAVVVVVVVVVVVGCRTGWCEVGGWVGEKMGTIGMSCRIS